MKGIPLHFGVEAGRYLTKDKLLSKLSPIFPKNLFTAKKALIEKSVKFSDVSFYQGYINWDILSTKSPAVIIRAGQNLWIDPEFTVNYREAKRTKIRRGVYWFYDSRVHPDLQAEILIDLLKEDPPEMEIFCDWEKDYGGAYFDLEFPVRFMKTVESAIPLSKVGMYTGYYFFKDHTDPNQHSSEYNYLKDKPLWLAWYTTNPEYVQIPAPWARVTHWQFTSSGDGRNWGCESNELDLNYFNGTLNDFNNSYGSGNTDVIKDHENGVVQINMERGGTSCFSLVCDPKKVEFKVTSGFSTLDKAVSDNNAFGGTNGDGWEPGTSVPISVAWSNGISINPEQKDFRPFLNITSSNLPEIDWKLDGVAFHNTVSGDRYLVQNGEINPSLFSRLREKNARTAVGITSLGKVVLFKCDGWDFDKVNGTPPKGLDWIELANVGIELGCVDFINLDGGGSSTMWANGSQLGVANDDGVVGMRHTVNHLLVLTKSNGGTVNNYEVVKIVRKRKGPSFYEQGNGDASLGQFESLSETITTESIPAGGPSYTVKWVQLPDGDWVPMKHYSSGEVYVVSLSQPSAWPEYFTLIDPENNEQIYDKRA